MLPFLVVVELQSLSIPVVTIISQEVHYAALMSSGPVHSSSFYSTSLHFQVKELLNT